MAGDFFPYQGGRVQTNQSILNQFSNTPDLEDLLARKSKTISIQEIIESYCLELRKILELAYLEQVIHGLLQLESKLTAVIDENEIIDHDDLAPSLSALYQRLTPLFLRSMLETMPEENEVEDIRKGWLEGLRIAIEEELYIWQEKIN